jgi:diguanylate cyclase (GGDEF)-like protein/PAS domain S-box-containing protein
MHPQGSGNRARLDIEISPDFADIDSLASDAAQPNDPAAAKPFLERRRQRSIKHSWHEALDEVHSLLVRYEDANLALAEAEESFRSLFENALIGIFRIGPAGEPLLVNRSMAKICGFDHPEQMLGEIADFGAQLMVDPSQWRDLLRRTEARGFHGAAELEVNAANGKRRWLQISLRTMHQDGGFAHFEGTAEDITERKISEQRMRMLAYYDVVTGLPNRSLFEERLNEALSAARWRSRRVALMRVELGRFKMINDSLGRSYGDRLLKEIAERIQITVGEEAALSRVGGAEFAVILQDVKDTVDVERTAAQVIEAVGGEFSFLGNTLNLSCNVGVSMFPVDGWEGQMLLERADVAMFTAKEMGANSFQFFTEKMNDQIRDRLRLENGLRLALERNELFLVYQAQVDTRTGQVAGLEALLRWTHPEKGLVPPAEFIGIAESSGLILPIGEWVLRTACAQARRWQDAGLRAVPVAVNVSAIQFRQQGFCSLVQRVLDETGLDPKYLELELTEGLLLTNVDVMEEVMKELRAMGVMITIDDFGTGYSSLGYLRQFKVNRLKIDRSFVRDVSCNADDAAITTAIINMAKALNLDVLAEGVENVEQLNFLREQNCYAIQGY